MASVAVMQKNYEEEVEKLQKDQDAFRENVESQQKYTAQLQENELVLQELKLLGEDAKVYKQIGPALVRQDVDESKGNVETRIEFMKKELTKLNKNAKSLQETLEKRRKHVAELQQKILAAREKKE